ncbi:MAG TPA: hypothetical protein VKK79_04895 [Candidatus Lokiarchaeia archaeon]|nr:hypothetical protein [Candidatus Lokiarchaeia archaeon]
MLDGDVVRENLKTIRAELFHAIDKGLNALRELIRKEYPDLLHKVGMPLAYEFVLKGYLSKNTKKQIDLVLKNALRYDGELGTLDAIVEETFDQYFQYDMTNQHCDRNHPKFSELQEFIKLSYRARIPPVWQLLQYEEKADYDTLIKEVFHTRETTRTALEEHFIIVDKAVDLIEQYPDLIKHDFYDRVYWARNIHIIRASYEYAQQFMAQRLDEIFPEESEIAEN